MYIRQCFRTVEGERRAYWALVESVRTERGPRQNVIAWLGALDEAGRLGVLQAARRNDNHPVSNVDASKFFQQSLFEFEDPIGRCRSSDRYRAGNTQSVRCKTYGTSAHSSGQARPQTANSNSRRQNVVETKKPKPNVFIVPSQVVGEVGLVDPKMANDRKLSF